MVHTRPAAEVWRALRGTAGPSTGNQGTPSAPVPLSSGSTRTGGVLYIAYYPKAVYVLNAFEGQARKSSRADVAVGKARLKGLSESRAERYQVARCP